ncbi:MAG TPA: DoxX family protein [Puia sp.]|nr:DoxX family protein [Puia sp.]
MKTTKILYWVFTILLIVMMLFSAISSFIPNPQGAEFAKHIGFPLYIFKFLAVAKILGVIAILVPGNPRLKEWAYAGFTFDLTGAVFSGLAVGDPIVVWIPVIVGLLFIFGSYITYHKIAKAKV